jgi:hypothetical protein
LIIWVELGQILPDVVFGPVLEALVDLGGRA